MSKLATPLAQKLNHSVVGHENPYIDCLANIMPKPSDQHRCMFIVGKPVIPMVFDHMLQ